MRRRVEKRLDALEKELDKLEKPIFSSYATDAMKYWRIDGNNGNAYYHTADALRMARLFYRVFHFSNTMYNVYVVRSDDENKFSCDPISYVFVLLSTTDTVTSETLRQYFQEYLYKHPFEFGMSWDLQLVKCEETTREQYDADFHKHYLAKYLCWYGSPVC